MTKSIPAALAAAAFLGASGCATTSPETTEGRTALVAAPLDVAYIAAVDHVAKQRGVRVIWVNAPRRTGERVRLSYPAIKHAPSDESDGGSR